MAIPDFQSIMLPILIKASNGKEFSLQDYVVLLADDFQLSEEERNELLPSGRQARFNNCVSWAAIYLYKAGLLERLKRGQYKISARGREVLNDNPSEINIKYLDRFQEFLAFRKPDKKKENNGTPEEALEAVYQTLKESLAEEPLAKPCVTYRQQDVYYHSDAYDSRHFYSCDLRSTNLCRKYGVTRIPHAPV